LLTAVNTARRCFLGGVYVLGDLDVPLKIVWRHYRTLGEAVLDLQGKAVHNVLPEIPYIVIGDAAICSDISEFAVRTTYNGWSGGIAPLDEQRLPEKQEFTPAGVLAGALAVSEAFQFVRGNNAVAGHRKVGMSLWRPGSENPWLDADPGPVLKYLPARLWLIGLGHLGQAYLWTLGFLPYARPADVQLTMQDFDVLAEANDSTSLLTTKALVGQFKTRAMADWCEQRGFRASIYERRFAPNFHVDDDEPHVALCGVDNPLARSALEEVGFWRIIEAGLGKGTEEYLAFQIHTFPASRKASDRWGGHVPADALTNQLTQQPAYRALAASGLDECGITLLAGRSVGASFVGAVTSTLVVAELLRLIMNGHRCEVIDGTLRALDLRQVIECHSVTDLINLGVTEADNLATT
jgi:hypothetical protein